TDENYYLTQGRTWYELDNDQANWGNVQTAVSGAITVGTYSNAIGVNSIALGNLAKTYGKNSLAVGLNSAAWGRGSLVIGHDAFAGTDDFTIKKIAREGSPEAYELELKTEKQWVDGVEMDVVAAKSNGNVRGLSIGSFSAAPGLRAMTVGRESVSYGDDSMVVGVASNALGKEGIAIGHESATGTQMAIIKGTDGKVSAGIVARDIDGHVLPVDENGDFILKKDDGKYYKAEYYKPDANSEGWYVATDTEAGSGPVEGGIAIGNYAHAEGEHALAVGRVAGAYDEHATSVGLYANAMGKDSIALGHNTVAGAQVDENGLKLTDDGRPTAVIDPTTQKPVTGAIAMGANAHALGDESLAVGRYTVASGADSTAIGLRAKAEGTDSLVLGHGANVLNQSINETTVDSINSIAIGKGATVTGQNTIAIGTGHVVTGNANTVIGDPNYVTGEGNFVFANDVGVSEESPLTVDKAVILGHHDVRSNSFGSLSTSLGANAQATVDNAVALGSGSIASRKAYSELADNDSAKTVYLKGTNTGAA
ncbi:MAG: hypothetical protein IK089_07290, partial [Oxalobacter sp.]|nr:hypothetical protein [Oxalobacter sp.]